VPDLARAAVDIGIRAVLSNDVALDEHNLDTLQDNKDAHDAAHGTGDGRVEVYVGIEWLPLASPELLRDARTLADELGTGIHVHLNESLTEVENSKERFGRRPTEVAYDSGLLGRRTIAAHCVWLSDTEIALMRETGTQISHNPSSNAKLGNGIARLPEMLAAGLNVGLGHDAAECNNSLDMFEVMKFASLMHRAARVDASLQQAPDVLEAGDPQRGGRPRPRDRPAERGPQGGRDPGRHPQRHVHAAGPGQRRAAVLAPGVRGQRQRGRHHDRGRPGAHARPEAADPRRDGDLAAGQRGLPARPGPDLTIKSEISDAVKGKAGVDILLSLKAEDFSCPRPVKEASS
jgi:hypothetical protein